MIPQGSVSLNVQYFINLKNSLSTCTSCEQLQEITDLAAPSISALKSAINAQIAEIAPILALLTLPGANPGAIVGWLGNLVSSVIRPQIRPYALYADQLSSVLSQVADVESSIAELQTKFLSCSISIPEI